MSSIEDYMNTRLVMGDLKSNVVDLAKLMVNWNVSSIAIINQEEKQLQNNIKQVIGILTERDIVRSISKGAPLDDITASSIMSSSPILSIKKDQSIEEAAFLMITNKVRHLLVEEPEQDKVIGIITATDLARYLRKRMKETPIATAATAAREENEERRVQDKQEKQNSSYSSERLLSEVWELYF